MRRLSLLAAVAAAAVLLWIGTPTQAQTNGAPARFTAMAVNMSGIGPSGSGQIEIDITRWSTDAEREKLLSTLMNQGADKLLDVLRDTPKVGYIRTPTSLGWDLHYARMTPLPDGGQRVVVATDRPISVREAFNNGRTMQYPFTVIEIHMNKNGEGKGTMSVATRVIADKQDRTIELENFGEQPVLLQDVKEQRLSR